MASGKQDRLEIAPGVVPAPGGEDQYNKATIQNLLNDTSPALISDIGFAYMHAASAIKDACAALKAQARELAEVWVGPDATQVQMALQELCRTGMEISTKMDRMSTGVRTYSETKLPEAISKVSAIHVDSGDQTEQNSAGGASGYSSSAQAEQAADQQAANAAAEEENRQAREALRTLNGDLNSIWASHIPVDIDVNLPAINIGAGDQHSPDDPYRGRHPGDIDISSDYNSSTGGGHQGATTGNDSGTTGGSHRGGQDGPGQGDRAGNDGTDRTGGGDQTDRPGDQTTPGDQTPDDGTPGDQTPGDQGDAGDAGQDDRQRDDAIPPVIGQDEQQRTSLGDTDDQIDPNRTENVSYEPTISQVTSTPNPNAVTTRPTTPLVTPTTSTPVTVIGGQVSGGAVPAASAGARGAGGAMFAGMPHGPLGYAGMIGEEGAELERTANLPEDRSVWDPHRDDVTLVSDKIS
ncbi:hypothetical protein GBF35_06115 [Nonomuraea phyllanthi]|uniref:hypothetical protein n=1 Tax=Nonomuraea phyllanthi TaxID=2219224 RepID=UPI0012930A74|nr:hypothetical protein [Nonomuraea phyllanthi]QFY06308.1 hypothetical protein GBF35_06115 [Nonomuraea phyllanthi]